MSPVLPELMTDAAPGERVVWGGRWAPRVRGALDEWACGRAGLLALLEEATEVVVLDALSFPWEVLRQTDRDIPLVALLPAEHDVDALEAVFGRILFEEITPFDRLVETRPEVRERLGETFGWTSDVWLTPDSPDLESALATIGKHCDRGLIDVETDLGCFRTPAGDLITRQLQEYGAHQRGGLNAVLAVLDSDDVVIDAGAHIGTFAVPIARTRDASAAVVAIEGSASHAALLRHNVMANGLEPVVTVVEAVLGGPSQVPVRPRQSAANTGGLAFLPSEGATPGSVWTTPLDRLVDAFPVMEKAGLLKIDVEGCELDVLKGAEQLIRHARPLIFLEVAPTLLEAHGASAAELERWLLSRDFELFLSAGVRNLSGPEWRLEPIGTFSEVDDILFDVLAVPAESGRSERLRAGAS